ncbi:hypothetical protein MCEMAEM4_03420 [Burkholderiaceae bacterium]
MVAMFLVPTWLTTAVPLSAPALRSLLVMPVTV